jgi:glycosyltransferase involved in cell wall biosynthesis
MVSVIMCTYNREHFIAESIYTVLQQSYSDLELIIIDDGSADNTQTLVNAIPDERLRYFKLPHTGCTGRMKNFGIRQAEGEYIAFNDSDDLWSTDKLQKQVALMTEHPAAGFCITNVTTFRGNTIVSPHAYPVQSGPECANIFNRMRENRFIVYNQSMLLRPDCLDLAGWFDEEMPSGDYHFHMRLAWHFDAVIIYESQVWRRMHDANVSDQLPIENYEEFIKTFEYLHQHRMVRTRHLQKARSHAFHCMGDLYRLRGNKAAAHQHYRQSLKYNPLQPRCLWHLLTTWPPAR